MNPTWQRMRRDFAKISWEIRTAQPHVPEVYLTVTRGISRERTQKIPQSRHVSARGEAER